jgi:hypothetical protein
MDRLYVRYRRFLAVWLVVWVVVAGGGCRTLLTTVVYLVKGTDIDAEFNGLTERKVAVVCRPLTSLTFRDCHVARDLAREVGTLLQANVHRIEVVDDDQVVAWTDEHDWTDYSEIGEAVEADLVVGIDLLDFTIYQGQTLYQGRANVALTVIDCTDGKRTVYEKELPESLYPPNTGIETFSTPEQEFRRKYVRILADQIGRHFYPHDPRAHFALDATVLD